MNLRKKNFASNRITYLESTKTPKELVRRRIFRGATNNCISTGNFLQETGIKGLKKESCAPPLEIQKTILRVFGGLDPEVGDLESMFALQGRPEGAIKAELNIWADLHA